MASLCLPSSLREGILVHARIEAPRECCGVLIGCAEGAKLRVESVRPGRNLADDPTRRYTIDPKILFEAHRTARDRGGEVLGYYHSHPSSPAVPSAEDRDGAWAGARHLIVGVREGVTEIRCWLFDSEPREEEILPC
ncbi:MAG: M67 family metallopeptidase [Thermoanaerobaculia bacterium]|nr:M67 family metallopeptidase [Thermoanaerobaculia bacterium]